MKYIILFFGLLFYNGNYAQELKKHKWENRILLIISKDSIAITQNDLITSIEKDSAGLKERQLIIYKVLPHSYTIDNRQIKNNTLYKAFNPEHSDFKFILIGLDGGIKLEALNPLSKTELFKIIDGMPMRASELKNKQ